MPEQTLIKRQHDKVFINKHFCCLMRLQSKPVTVRAPALVLLVPI